MTTPSTRDPNLAQPDRLKNHVSPSEQEAIINSLRDIDPIAYDYYFNPFMGKTKEGGVCYFPESYRKGYQDFLDGRKLTIELEMFAMGQTSGGDWVFLPSYFHGADVARNNLRFVLLAENQRRLFDESSRAQAEVLKHSHSLDTIVAENTWNKNALEELHKGYENLHTENQSLKQMVESQKNIVNEYKDETKQLKEKLQEVKTMLQNANIRQVKSSNITHGDNNRAEKRKGAAPIS